MNKDKKILVFSHKQFDTVCAAHGWNDDNVESLSNNAFISIIGTKECRKFWMDEDREHWFKHNHPNVLNLDYDDLFSDKMYEGHLFKAMSDDQALESVEFIERNLNKNFYIHCHAGISRSQAYFRFITDFYPQIYTSTCGRKENPCNSPNMAVVSSLNTAYKKIYDLNKSCFGEIEK